MSGHSKWHSIRHKKAVTDARRGKLFTKLIKEISVAARLGGGELESNSRLRTAVQSAGNANMPRENIKRAIMKGTGELPGQSYEQATYEGYGPGGVAVFVECLTDNKNRTVADIRYIFSKHSGHLGENGSVQWMFERKGYIAIERGSISEEKLLDLVLEAGAEDLSTKGDTFYIYTPFESFEILKQTLEKTEIPISFAKLTMVTQGGVSLTGKPAEQMINLMETLEDHDDVQNVYASFDIDESELEALAIN